MSIRILIADDEPLYIRLLQINLASEGYEVITAVNGEEALEKISTEAPDLVILDIMMPRLDGITVCERVRQYSNIPVIILTARGEEQDRVQGLNVGADDYIVKPFSATEMLARVRAVLRRTQTNRESTQGRFFDHGSLRIDFARAEVWKASKPVFLSATEYRLLIQFAHNLGQVLSAEQLLGAIWGPAYREDKEILWVSIARLRQKLEDNPHSPQHIVTRAGLGYLMPPIEKESQDQP
ncbi:MAG: response regulator transcription factor [Chloroflexi bacterium]|nr:response regulator transcription factor [Chloroflexota bacterium]